MKDTTERSLNKINNPTRILGLKSIDIIMIFALICLAALVSVYTLILAIPLVIWFIRIVNKAYKNDCPDYFTEFFNKLNVKTYFVDKDDIMSKL